MADFIYCLKTSKDGLLLCREQKGHDGPHIGLRFRQPEEVRFE